MIRLEDSLTNFPNTSSLSEIDRFVGRAEGEITFFGKRFVKVEGYTGSVEWDFFLDKISCSISGRNENGDLSIANRISGLNIEEKLRKLYRDTDQQFSAANFLTRNIVSIQDIRSQGIVGALTKGNRFYLFNGNIQQEFMKFSVQEFDNTFDKRNPPKDSSGAVINSDHFTYKMMGYEREHSGETVHWFYVSSEDIRRVCPTK